MSSAVIPDENIERDYLNDQQISGDGNDPALSDRIESLRTGRKKLRTSVSNGADNSERRERLLSNIAAAKGDTFTPKAARRMAENEYEQLIQEATIRIREQQPNLDLEEVQILAEEQVLSGVDLQNKVRTGVVGRVKQGKDLIKKGRNVAKLAKVAKLSNPAGWAWLIGGEVLSDPKKRKALITAVIFLCLCCFGCIAFIFTQVGASENKVDSVFRSANLLYEAGTGDIPGLIDATLDIKSEEYASQEPTPE